MSAEEDPSAPPRPRKKRKRPRPTTGDLVILLRTEDPLRAQMVTDLLEQEDIPVATPGLVQRSALGALGAFADIVVRVPEEDLDRARAIVAALDEGAPAQDPDDEPVTYRASRKKPKERTAPVRLARVAVFVAFILPGGGHMYLGRYRPAFVLVALQMAVWFALHHEVPYAGLVWPVGFVVDAFVSTRLCRISQERIGPEKEPRWAVAMAAIVVLGGLFALSGPVARSIAGPGDSGSCEFSARCTNNPQSAIACTIAAANARLDGAPPSFGNACGVCIAQLPCEDARTGCVRECAHERGEDDD